MGIISRVQLIRIPMNESKLGWLNGMSCQCFVVAAHVAGLSTIVQCGGHCAIGQSTGYRVDSAS